MNDNSRIQPPQSDEEFAPYSRDFEERFFKGTKPITVELTLMENTWDEIQAVLKENDWAQEEGLLILLTTGMAFLRAERALTIPSEVAGLRDEEVKKLLTRLIETEQRFAVMKNFSYYMMRDHQAMELKYAAVERMGVWSQALAERRKAENRALKAEIERLRLQLPAGEPAASLPEADKLPGDSRSRWRRILDILFERPAPDN